jgi:hypothetical protein
LIDMSLVEEVIELMRIVNERGSKESNGLRKAVRNLNSSGMNLSSLVRSGEIGIGIGIVIGHGNETEMGKANGRGNVRGTGIGTTRGVIEIRRGIEITIAGIETATVNETDQGKEIATEIETGTGTQTETTNGEIATRIETTIGGIETGTGEVVVHVGERRGEKTDGKTDEKTGGKTGGKTDEKTDGKTGGKTDEMRDVMTGETRSETTGETRNETISGKGTPDESAIPLVIPEVKGRTRTTCRSIGIFQGDDQMVYRIDAI